MLVHRLRKLDRSLAQLVQPDYFQTGQVKPAPLAVTEPSAAALAPVNALHAAAARSAIHWVPPNAIHVHPALTPNSVRASVPYALREPMPINLAQAHAHHVRRAIFL